MAILVSNFPVLEAVDEEIPHPWLEPMRSFVSSSKDAFSFESKTNEEKLEFTRKLLELVHSLLRKPAEDPETVEICLAALVIMSRDVTSVENKFNRKEVWDDLTLIAGLKSDADLMISPLYRSIPCKISCCKCLSNLIFITKDSNGFASDTDFALYLLDVLSTMNPDVDDEQGLNLEILHLRLLFLVTAFNPDSRGRVAEEYNGRRALIDKLSSKVDVCRSSDKKSPCCRAIMLEANAKSSCEIFKAMFNMNMKLKDEQSEVQDHVAKDFEKLISICRKYLLLKVENNEEYGLKLKSDTLNCLYSVTMCFKDSIFLPPIQETSGDAIFTYEGPDLPTFENHDVSALMSILSEVERRLQNEEISTENLLPMLSLLITISQSSRICRKYCKQYVIPPRTDFVNRPEMGSEFRNKLIKLFTHANTEVKGAAADFIFVLCKENVNRLVKHTGYGNAAGLLASRGLLAGGRGKTAYSDTESDSDTEEYLENVDKINPITGHIQPELPDPMEGMSDEQKEYLAVQLANQLTKLSNDDVIQPVCVDPKSGELIPFQQKFHETVIPEEKDSDDDSN